MKADDVSVEAVATHHRPQIERELEREIERELEREIEREIERETGRDVGMKRARPPDFETLQRRYFEQVLAYTHGRIYGPQGAAVIVGMPPTTLQSRLKKLGIDAATHRR